MSSDELAKCIEYIKNNPTLFFVGSGVSVSYPTVIPSAWEMLHEITLPLTIPNHVPTDEISALSKSLPELYYEALIEFTDPKATLIWQTLNLGNTNPELKQYKLGPNEVHIALVLLANYWRLPILTTNFDTMLENATKKLGLVPIVSYNIDKHDFREALQENEVAIWKLHGCVSDITSIHTTLYTITQLHRKLFDKLKKLFEKYRSCLIGYSGRDIDLFPKLLDFNFPTPAFWIDPFFNTEHRINHIQAMPGTPDKFVAVRSDGTSFAKEVLKNLMDDKLITQMRKNVIKEFSTIHNKNKLKECTAVKERYLLIAKDYARKILDPMLPKTSLERLLIHGLSLASIGRNEAALHYLNRYISLSPAQPQKICRAHIVQAYSSNVLSRYIDSEHYARRAAALALKFKLKDEYGHALAAIDSALLQQYLPRIGFIEQYRKPTNIIWKMLFRMIYDIFRIKANVLPSLKASSKSAQIRARWAYLGHIGRTMALLQSRILILFSDTHFMENFIKRQFVNWWLYFKNVSEDNGYAVGIASSLRYIKRLIPNETQLYSATSLYSLISGFTEQALIFYDRGNYLVDEGNYSLAQEEYKKALEYAKLDGNLSVLLKTFIGIKRSGATVNVDEIEQIIKNIQGEAYRQIESDLVKWFKENK